MSSGLGPWSCICANLVGVCNMRRAVYRTSQTDYHSSSMPNSSWTRAQVRSDQTLAERPQPHGIIPRAGGQRATIGAEGDGGHRCFVGKPSPFVQVLHGCPPRRPEFYETISNYGQRIVEERVNVTLASSRTATTAFRTSFGRCSACRHTKPPTSAMATAPVPPPDAPSAPAGAEALGERPIPFIVVL